MLTMAVCQPVIPIMAKHQVKALHIGTNSACVAADTSRYCVHGVLHVCCHVVHSPGTSLVFRWQHRANELLTMLHSYSFTKANHLVALLTHMCSHTYLAVDHGGRYAGM
jgi:hypothetical protein